MLSDSGTDDCEQRMFSLLSVSGTMMRLRAAVALLMFAVLAACATAPMRYVSDSAQLMHDDAFPGAAAHAVESREDVFKLDRDARIRLDEKAGAMSDADPGTRVEHLVHHAALDVSYDSSANTTASETLHNQVVNCLSMSILAYSIAGYLGIEAAFQEVNIPEYWERRDNVSLMTHHINVRLKAGTGNAHTRLERDMEVDFLPFGDTQKHQRRPIPQSKVLAMFYNNKGIDALLAGNYDVAYSYFKAALREHPSLDMALTNLGALYLVNGHLQWAENSFRQAMQINPHNTVNAESLANLLKKTGRNVEAGVLLDRLERDRKYNPYYQYIQGEEAFDAGDWPEAIDFFRRAIRLKSDASEFHFGLAKTYAALGDHDRANAAALIGELRSKAESGEERSRPCRPHRAYPAYYFLPC